MPNNCVVAEKLTETVLRSVFRSHGIPYSGGVMFREETWSKACAPSSSRLPLARLGMT